MHSAFAVIYILAYALIGIAGMRRDIIARKPLWYILADSLCTISTLTMFTAWFSADLERLLGAAIWALLLHALGWHIYSAPEAIREMRAEQQRPDTHPWAVRWGIAFTFLIGIIALLPAFVAGVVVGIRHLPAP